MQDGEDGLSVHVEVAGPAFNSLTGCCETHAAETIITASKISETVRGWYRETAVLT